MQSFKISEFEIQAQLFMMLRNSGVNVKGEYKYKNCRFDLAIFKNDKLFSIVEVKSYVEYQKPNLDTKQLAKYRSKCKNVYVIGREEDLISVYNIIIKDLES
jgi:hypothetical protein